MTLVQTEWQNNKCLTNLSHCIFVDWGKGSSSTAAFRTMEIGNFSSSLADATCGISSVINSCPFSPLHSFYIQYVSLHCYPYDRLINLPLKPGGTNFFTQFLQIPLLWLYSKSLSRSLSVLQVIHSRLYSCYVHNARTMILTKSLRVRVSEKK